MCWSSAASITITGLGIAATAVAITRKQPKGIWLTLGYFTIMEALQVGGYSIIDECGSASNRTIALLSYLHIAFQPFFINAFAMELVPEPVKVQIRHWVYFVCCLCTAVMLAQLYPFAGVESCRIGEPMCGAAFCVVSGDWHIAWNIPYNGLLHPFQDPYGYLSGIPTYFFAVFLLPLVYGAWRLVVFHAFAGPLLAWSLTSNPNEWPAIWCLFSIGILLIGSSPLINKRFRTASWWVWPKAWLST